MNLERAISKKLVKNEEVIDLFTNKLHNKVVVLTKYNDSNQHLETFVFEKFVAYTDDYNIIMSDAINVKLIVSLYDFISVTILSFDDIDGTLWQISQTVSGDCFDITEIQ